MKTPIDQLFGFHDAANWGSIATIVLVVLSTCVDSGCSKKPPTKTAAIETGGLEENLVEVVEPEPTSSEIWDWLIESAAQGQSSSISMPAPISNSMLEQLTKTPEILELLLDRGVVDDLGIELIVKSCPELEHLRVRLSPITDAGGKQLAKLTKLRLINLPQAKVSISSFQAWQQLPHLNHLRLGGKQIDDAALAEIVKLPQLQSLHLIGPSLSDEGLQQLAAAKNLSSFYIDDCPLSQAAWDKLKKVRPDLHIHVDQHHPDR